MKSFTKKSPPNGHFLGIAKLSSNKETMNHAARQFASINYAKLKNSIGIDKALKHSEENLEFNNKAKVKYSVTDNQEMKLIAESLKEVEQFEIFGYFIGLYTLNKETNPSPKFSSKISIPKNLQAQINKREGSVTLQAYSSSAYLTKAWNLATAELRSNLNQFIKTDVSLLVKQYRQKITKTSNMSSVNRLSEIVIISCDIEAITKENLPSYKIHLIAKTSLK